MSTVNASRTFRKSPVAYIGSVLLTLILVFILSAVAAGGTGGVRSFFELLTFLAVVRGIYRLFYLHTIRWVVSPQGLSVSRGILPWRKWHFLAPYETIFEAFYTTKPNGMGMGLAISRSIIEAHAGRLWAEANRGRGATFSISLPAAREGSLTPAPYYDRH